MTNKTYSRGFTLIELLVVIAIIGILASVVLASLNSARDKGADAAIKSTINNMRAQAELFYDNNSRRYSTDTTVLASAACPTTGNTMFVADTAMSNAIESARSANGGTLAAVTRCAVGVNGASYAIAVQLRSVSTGAWYCVDSAGTSLQTTSATAPALGGGAAVAACP